MEGGSHRSRKPRILIVEDDFLIAIGISDAISVAGGSVVGPVDNIAAAVALSLKAIDGAILDVRLAGGKVSYPIAERLSRENVGVVFYTAGTDKKILAARFPDAIVIDKSKPARIAAREVLRLVG